MGTACNHRWGHDNYYMFGKSAAPIATDICFMNITPCTGTHFYFPWLHGTHDAFRMPKIWLKVTFIQNQLSLSLDHSWVKETSLCNALSLGNT